MTTLESAVLGILALLLTGHLAGKSITDEIMRMISCAAIMGAYWILVVIAGKELIALAVANLF